MRDGHTLATREAYDTESECIVTLHSDLLQPNDGHPLRYMVQYPSGIMSTQDADKIRLFADTPTAPVADCPNCKLVAELIDKQPDEHIADAVARELDGDVPEASDG